MAQDYSRITSAFWTGHTGKRLRGRPHAQVLALYLVSCRAASPIGIFSIAKPTMVHETGLRPQQVAAALDVLAREEFAIYDEEREEVWLPEMARIQIGPVLQVKDKRWSWVKRWLEQADASPFVAAFLVRYESIYHLDGAEVGRKPENFEAPSKPLRSPFEAPPKGGESPSEANPTPPHPIQPHPTPTRARDEQPDDKTQAGEKPERRRDLLVDAAWETFASVGADKPAAGLLHRWVKTVFAGDEGRFLRCLDALALTGALAKPPGYLVRALEGMVARGECAEISPEPAESAAARHPFGKRTLDGSLVWDGKRWVAAEEFSARFPDGAPDGKETA